MQPPKLLRRLSGFYLYNYRPNRFWQLHQSALQASISTNRIGELRRMNSCSYDLQHYKEQKILLSILKRYWFLYLLHKYWQLMVESLQSNISIALRTNIPTTKSQTGNILGTIGIWKHWNVSNVIIYSTLTGIFYS